MRSSLSARSPSTGTPLALRAILSAALACSTLVAPAAASWPHDANNLLVSAAPYLLENPVVVPDGSGGAIITWQENHGGVSLKDIAAQHVLASGKVDPSWPVGGRAICSAVNQQQDPKLVSDGAGGAIIVWEDLRSGTSFDLYAQHLLASGVVDPAWPVDGRAIAVAAGDQFAPVITTDNAGGAIVAWRDRRNGVDDDIFVQRVNAGGNAVFAANGIDITSGQPGNQNSASICPDGVGGAVVAWVDARSFATSQNDIYMQRISAGGGVYWSAGGRAICTDVQEQESPTIIPDMVDGYLLVWMDKRLGANFDIYATRTNSSGVPQWASNGIPVCSAAGDQSGPLIVADGLGGANVVWVDRRAVSTYQHIYAQHLLFWGVVDPAAPVDGRVVCTASIAQSGLCVTSDGTGGAVACWMDVRDVGPWTDLYAGHILASGVIDTVWLTNGRAVSTAPNNQLYPTICSDAAGGAIITWEDERDGPYNIYAQRVDRFGYLGTPGASIAGVRDVPNDQGGRIKLSWDASYLDLASDPNLNWYEVYRSVPPNVAARATAAGTHIVASPAEVSGASRRALLTTVTNATTYYWEYLATLNAQHFLPGYSYLAATSGDSIGASNPKTVFMVVARNATGSFYWLSLPDSGYSVDNLPPFTPAPFTGQYSAGATHLHWNRNREPDLANYQLYRGAIASFVPGPASLIAAPPDTGFADSGPAGSFYKLSAVDAHGNESMFASLTPAGTLEVGGDRRLSFALAGPHPNPARGNRMRVEFVLAVATPARLELLDVSGRLVAAREVGTLGAGSHSIDLAAGRRLPPGLYLVRLTQGTETRTVRAVVLD